MKRVQISTNIAIIIQQDATEYSLRQFVNCCTCFGWYFTHGLELITLYLKYLALFRLLLLPVVSVTEWELTCRERHWIGTELS